MSKLDRRSFLRALVAGAVASQLPKMAAATAAPFTDRLTDQLAEARINGKNPTNITLTDVGNGWVRVVSTFDASDGTMVLDFSKLNGGRGLYVGDGNLEPPEGITIDATRACVESGPRCMTMSMFVKMSEKYDV